MTPAEVIKLLSFEDEHNGAIPNGWSGGPAGTVAADDEMVHGGRWSVRLERNSESAQRSSTISKSIPITFAGSRIELRGYLRTVNVSNYAGLWMREDGDSSVLAVDDMRRQELKGTTDWTEYSISLPLHEEAGQLTFGVAVTGEGKIWADDLQLLVDGRPFWQAPQRRETIISRDHEFDGGSRIAVHELTTDQIQDLTVLGKVWGFLKYHHPAVTSGSVHHDYELFRIMPAVLSAIDGAAAKKELHKWVTSLKVESCTKCAALNTEKLHLRPQLGWLSDLSLLGRDLSNSLRTIYRNRAVAPAGQFYVSLATEGNPVFRHELAYGSIKLPDAGYQLLALFRFWNMIEYWFPYRDIIGENWGNVLTEFIPRVARAQTREAYQLEMMALISRVNDTHANLWSSLNIRPPTGRCQVPVRIRFIESQAVVDAHADGQRGVLESGDAIDSVDGVPVPELVARWAPYYAASNEPTRLRDIGGALLKGNCVETLLRVSRGEEKLEVKAPRVAQSSFKLPRWHELPGETFRKLSDDVAYLKISSAREDDAKTYVEAAAGTKGLVIDLRSYPSSFMVFALGSHLVDKPTPFARFTKADLTNPGAFYWAEPEVLHPAKPYYEGKIVILVDEISQSSAEFTAMAFRASPRAKVVGSTTAAADGNTSVIPLPGGCGA